MTGEQEVSWIGRCSTIPNEDGLLQRHDTKLASPGGPHGSLKFQGGIFNNLIEAMKNAVAIKHCHLQLSYTPAKSMEIDYRIDAHSRDGEEGKERNESLLLWFNG